MIKSSLECGECGSAVEYTGRNTAYCPYCDVCPDCGCPNADGFSHYDTCNRDVRWRVYSFDVWGNARDGYEVNDVRLWDTLHIPNKANDEDFVRALKRANFLKRGCRFSSFDLEWEADDSLFISDSRDGMPICRLVREN